MLLNKAGEKIQKYQGASESAHEVENETHFLLKCNAYTDRNDFFDWISNNHVPNFKNLSLEDKFTSLMSQEVDLITLARKINN